MNDNARDPYVGLNQYFGRKAAGAVPSWYAVGKVISTSPLKIRADGLDLDIEDLYIAQHLTAGWIEQLTSLSWPLTANLPRKQFDGKCNCSYGSGSCYVIRPEETVEGETAEAAPITHGALLKAGDMVLLIRSADGQNYYLEELDAPADPQHWLVLLQRLGEQALLKGVPFFADLPADRTGLLTV